MSARYFTAQDVDPSLILGAKIAMIGYGNQGRPQSLNLRDSGCDVIVGARADGPSWRRATSEGFVTVSPAEAAKRADFIMMCAPDTEQGALYREHIAPHLNPTKTLAFCHGFAIRFGSIQPAPDVDVVLIGPKGTGPSLRAAYEAGRGTPALVATHQDASGRALDKALSYGWAVGAARAFMLETTFAQETEADLFGEQAVLCGGLPELIKASIDTLVDAGIAPEVAYFECLSDCKLVLDLLYERGFGGMRAAISDTAQWGGLAVGPELIDDAFRAKLKSVLSRIQNGEFARTWTEERGSGGERWKALRAEEAALPIEAVSAGIRARLAVDAKRDDSGGQAP